MTFDEALADQPQFMCHPAERPQIPARGQRLTVVWRAPRSTGVQDDVPSGERHTRPERE